MRRSKVLDTEHPDGIVPGELAEQFAHVFSFTLPRLSNFILHSPTTLHKNQNRSHQVSRRVAKIKMRQSSFPLSL